LWRLPGKGRPVNNGPDSLEYLGLGFLRPRALDREWVRGCSGSHKTVEAVRHALIQPFLVSARLVEELLGVQPLDMAFGSAGQLHEHRYAWANILHH
jgi:hypothetical protein